MAAEHQVAQMLAAFQPPPGATATGQPDPLPSGLQDPPFRTGAETQVTAVAWYSSSQTPDQVLAWLQARPPTGSSPSGSGRGGEGPSFLTFAFSTPLNELTVSPESVSGGRTVIRLDASATWTPSRPASSMLGYGATSVSVVTTNPMNPQMPVPADETIQHTSTDPTVIHKVIDLVNGLQPEIPGARNCAMDLGERVVITLPGVATVKADAGGCGEATVTAQDGAKHTYAGGDLIRNVYALFGITWSQTTDLRPDTERTAASGTR